MKKILYTGFFILKTNYEDLGQSIKCTAKKGHSRFKLIYDMLYCSIKYGSSFVDYFNFRFYEKSTQERKKYASMGNMYVFHNKINDRNFIERVDDKKEFFKNFSKFCNKVYMFNKSQKQEIADDLSLKIGNKIVVKDPGSTGGKGVKIYKITKENEQIFIGDLQIQKFLSNHFLKNEIFYFEDYIKQHELINKISPTGVNTLRMITLINNHNEVEIIGAVFRISVNCNIDNYSAGNLAAEIDKNSGKVITGGIRKRSSCDKYHEMHPTTGEQILGFTIPYWNEVKEMVMEAALVIPQVRSVGWDIAITEKGPIIIEGNSKWNKDTWQIPAGHGKLDIIKDYL